MHNSNGWLAKLFLTLAVFSFSTLTLAHSTATIKKDTNEYLLDIKYPDKFKSAEVNKAVEDFIKTKQSDFMKELVEDAGVPPDAPGKTSLTIHYKIVYNEKNALSIRFDHSIYHRGAAHPLSSVTVLNFINDKPVQLNDLFKKDANYLKPISAFCNKAITAKEISSKDVISDGTAPAEKNYKDWYFTKHGLDIVFNTYQVAAYVYGAQTVALPLDQFSQFLKPELAKQVWGKA